MTTHTLNNHNLIVIDVPEGAANFNICEGVLTLTCRQPVLSYEDLKGIKLPPKNWQLIQTEEDAKGVVEYREGLPFTDMDLKQGTRYYNDYQKPLFLPPNWVNPVDYQRPFSTAIESLHSWIKSINRDPNRVLVLKEIK